MKAYRKDGKLIIEIDEEGLCNGTHLMPGCDATVTDKEKFLNFCAAHICDFGDNGDFFCTSQMTRLIDALVTEAIDSDQGIEV